MIGNINSANWTITKPNRLGHLRSRVSGTYEIRRQVFGCNERENMGWFMWWRSSSSRHVTAQSRFLASGLSTGTGGGDGEAAEDVLYCFIEIET